MEENASKPRRYQKRKPEFPAEAEDSSELSQEPVAPPETPAPVVVAPPPPNPAVIALQEDIVRLIRQRGDVRAKMLNANAALQQAQAGLQLVQAEMRTLEEEVQYLHSQCAMLEGRQPSLMTPGERIGVSGEPPFFAQMPGSFSGISSEPTLPPRPSSFAAPDGVNRAHAVREVL